MKYTYLLVDFTCIIVPFIASFYPKHPFYKEWKYFFPANFIVALFFIIWDIIFTERGVWGFNADYLTGYNIVNLPIEEVLFFVKKGKLILSIYYSNSVKRRGVNIAIFKECIELVQNLVDGLWVLWL